MLTDGVWKIVGNRLFNDIEEAWAPPKVDTLMGESKCDDTICKPIC